MPTLDWLGKDKAIKASKEVRFRLLTEVPEYSYGDKNTGNMIVHGDNLEALKALLPYYKGRVKCIYIDPPYNTGSAFEQYDDNLEHSIWLSMMYPRLELLHDFLREDGSIWISIDDDEQAYLKSIVDEIFGRNNFVGSIIWEKADSPRMDAKLLSSRHDYILVYAKHLEQITFHRIAIEDKESLAHYNKVDNNGKKYYLKPLRAMGKNDSRALRPNLYFGMNAPDGSIVYPVRADGIDGSWRWSQKKISDNLDKLEWVKGRKGWSLYYKIFADEHMERPPETIWFNKDVGSNRTSKIEVNSFIVNNGRPFSTPKPERLIKRIIEISTDSDCDIVMDTFLGSGTTAAVAQKMNRHFIGVELEDTAFTHVVPRLQKVVDGEQGGISKAEKWEGGGGYKFYRLGDPLYDDNGLLNKNVNVKELGAFIFYKETQTSIPENSAPPFLGTVDGISYYLLYSSDKDTCLNLASYKALKAINGKKVIYADICRMSAKKLKEEQIEFKQIPYDLIKLGR